MNVIDQGHIFELATYNGDACYDRPARLLTFMKRSGPGSPGNVGSFPGTNCQEVIRALISRVTYLDAQKPCAENEIIINSLRSALWAFEVRAARRRNATLSTHETNIEYAATCDVCGHIDCNEFHLRS